MLCSKQGLPSTPILHNLGNKQAMPQFLTTWLEAVEFTLHSLGCRSLLRLLPQRSTWWPRSQTGPCRGRRDGGEGEVELWRSGGKSSWRGGDLKPLLGTEALIRGKGGCGLLTWTWSIEGPRKRIQRRRGERAQSREDNCTSTAAVRRHWGLQTQTQTQIHTYTSTATVFRPWGKGVQWPTKSTH